MDFARLSVAPWTADGERAPDGSFPVFAQAIDGTWPRIISVKSWGLGACQDATNAAFLALARNAFDVMLRRRWHPWCGPSGPFRVVDVYGDFVGPREIGQADPFTALVEADKWYRRNV